MKIKISTKGVRVFFSALVVLFFSATSAEAYQTWRTASGKSYDVYTFPRVSKKTQKTGPVLHVISYRTTLPLKDIKGITKESNDLITHYYHFYLNAADKNTADSIVTTEAFRTISSDEGPAQPSVRRTLEMKAVKKMAENHSYSKQRMKAIRDLQWLNFKNAITGFKSIRKKTASDYLLLGKAYLLSKKQPRALITFQHGVKAFPQNITLLNNLAVAKVLMGTFKFEGVYEYDPEAIEDAKTYLFRAKKLDPNNWITVSNEAYFEHVLKNMKKAEKLYLKAYEINPFHMDLAFRIGGFYHEQKKFKNAKKFYEKALSHFTYYTEGRFPASDREVKKIKNRLKLVEQKKLFKKK